MKVSVFLLLFIVLFTSGCNHNTTKNTSNKEEVVNSKLVQTEFPFRNKTQTILVDEAVFTQIPEITNHVEKSILLREMKNLRIDEMPLQELISTLYPGMEILGEKELITKKVYIDSYSGNILEFLSFIEDVTGIFSTVKGKTIEFSLEKTFFTRMPPNLDKKIGKEWAENFEVLGAKDVFYNPVTETIIYKVNYDSFKNIERFLKEVEDGLIVIDFNTWIFEVELNKGVEQKIDFSRFGIQENTSISSKFTVNPKAKTISTKNLVDFLNSKGFVKRLSMPTLTMISGSGSHVSKLEDVSKRAKNKGVISAQDFKKGFDISIYSRVFDDSVFFKYKFLIKDLVFETTNKAQFNQNINQFELTELNNARMKIGDFFLFSSMSYKSAFSQKDKDLLDLLFNLNQNDAVKNINSQYVFLIRPVVTIFKKDKSLKDAHLKDYKGHSLFLNNKVLKDIKVRHLKIKKLSSSNEKNSWYKLTKNEGMTKQYADLLITKISKLGGKYVRFEGKTNSVKYVASQKVQVKISDTVKRHNEIVSKNVDNIKDAVRASEKEKSIFSFLKE